MIVEHPAQDRRTLLKLAAAGAVAGATAPLVGTMARASGRTEALLLSCMDFRLMNEIESYMTETRGLRDKYDHIVLAGASLGALTDKYPAWNQTFWEHLAVAIQLHGIHRVIVMDHRDCGAYKVILGEDFGKSPDRETDIHRQQLQRLKSEILKKHSHLEIDLLLMGLDGKVQEIGPA